jgi:predicted SAM-dependent methyltransferase
MINIIYPKDGWILQSMAEKLLCGIPKSIGINRSDLNEENFSELLENDNVKVNYYINYALFRRKTKKIDCAWFTHPEHDGRFFSVGNKVDFAISNSEKYRRELSSYGVKSCTVIPGVSPNFRPRLVVGFVGRFSSYGHRKGQDLLSIVSKVDWIDLRLTNGAVEHEALPSFFSSVDCVLISSRYEGGPMCLLEGLACGKPIVCPPDIGLAEFFLEQLAPYKNGDSDSLIRTLWHLYQPKLQRYLAVERFSWERWIDMHARIFSDLVAGKEIEPEDGDYLPRRTLPASPADHWETMNPDEEKEEGNQTLSACVTGGSTDRYTPTQSSSPPLIGTTSLPIINQFAEDSNISNALLHLGCGGMYLKGWINIDNFDFSGRDSSRSGSTYDIKMDIRDLDVLDNSVSGILLVHVLEHFVRWEAIRMLEHFYEKLHPGGELIIEMPDLDQCIAWYQNRTDKIIKTPLGHLNKGFTQFYGNQWDELEYETHRYVWTKIEIAQVLRKIGFAIKELSNAARFHEPERDMFVRALKVSTGKGNSMSG